MSGIHALAVLAALAWLIACCAMIRIDSLQRRVKDLEDKRK